MIIPLSHTPAVYSANGFYFSQRSPEEWERLRELIFKYGGFLPEINIEEEERKIRLYRDMLDRLRKMRKD